MKYRAEVDGLRAVAVIPVILFHAGFELFSGGFVGVDIFFVISGYLITTILIDDLENKRFSIVHFYERRARRILPALFFVMLCCIPFGWLWMLPREFKDFSESLSAVSLFISNFLFWSESDYFATAAEKKPLLHTWSLAVEEQYYVLFPIFLFLMWRFGKNRVFWMILVTTACSLALSEWGWRNQATANFYLAPTRAWELFAGSIASFIVQKHGVKPNNTLALLGFSAIAFSIFVYDENTPFPSVYALVPVLGVVLLVLYAEKETFVARLLSTKFFVGIGLISYSAYLWHQPLFAFARIRLNSEPDIALISLLIFTTMILAFLSWKYIEKPFRNKKIIGKKLIFTFSAIAITTTVSLGVLGHYFDREITYLRYKNNLAKTKTYDALEKAQNTSPVFIRSNRFDNGECKFSVENLSDGVANRLLSCHKKYGPGVLVIGDSHATNLYHSLVSNPKNEKIEFLVGITKNGCDLPTSKPGCQYNEVLQFINKNNSIFSHAVYEKAGYLMLENYSKLNLLRSSELKSQNFRADAKTVDGVILFLENLAEKIPVVWFGPRIEPLIGEYELFDKTCEHAFTVSEEQTKVYQDLDEYLKSRIRADKKIAYVSQIQSYKLRFPEDYGSCDGLLWMDKNHYSALGEEVFGARYNLLENSVFLQSN